MFFRSQCFALLGVLHFALALPTAAHGGYVQYVRGLNPIDYWRLGETSGPAQNLGTPHTPTGTYGSNVTRGADGPNASSGFRNFLPTNRSVQFPLTTAGNSNSVVDLGAYAPVTGDDARTILAWVRPTALNTPTDNPFGIRTILYYGSESANQRFRVHLMENNLALDVRGRGVRVTDTALSVGEWSFIALSMSDGDDLLDVRLYMNGELQVNKTILGAAGPLTINTGAGPSFLLGRHPGAAFDFEGNIDEVAFFNRALSGEEILQLYELSMAAPEPSTFVLLGLLALALPWALRRRWRSRSLRPEFA